MLTANYNPSIICLSFGIAFLGGYLTITFCHLLLSTFNGNFKLKVLNNKSALFIMACSLGGVGVWCMHFIGMFSVKLFRPDGSNISIEFNLFPTLLSLLIVIVFAGTGLYIASFDVMFGKTKNQIIEIYLKNAKNETISQIRQHSTVHVLWIIYTQNLKHLVGGGIVSGAGVSVMHYLGMWGMVFQDGRITWNIGVVVASCFIAIIASTAAFWILFRLLSLYPHLEILRITSAFIMAVAVCGMHYTGMAAANFEYYPGILSTNLPNSIAARITNEHAFYGTLLAAVLFGVVLVLLAFSELRYWVLSTSIELRRYESLIEQLKKDNCNSYALENFLNRQKPLFSPQTSQYGAKIVPSNTLSKVNNRSTLPPSLSKSASGTPIKDDRTLELVVSHDSADHENSLFAVADDVGLTSESALTIDVSDGNRDGRRYSEKSIRAFGSTTTNSKSDLMLFTIEEIKTPVSEKRASIHLLEA